MPYTIEETLKSGDLPSDLKPHLVYGQVMEGARKKLVFIQAVKEDESLIGSVGTKISVPIMSQVSASTASESSIDSSGYSASTITMTDTDVSIGNEVYAAVKLSKILLEDQPDIEWVRLCLKNIGLAVMEYLDAAIRDALISGAGNTVDAATSGTLAYGDVASAVAKAKSKHWYPEEGDPFLLFVHPNNAVDILKSTTFTEPSRYTAGELTGIAGNAEPLIAGCKVLETSGMTENLALVVAPPTHQFGPSTILAWKRKLAVDSKEEQDYARTFYVASARYGVAVVNADAIVLISNC